jgi:hypothetical protein
VHGSYSEAKHNYANIHESKTIINKTREHKKQNQRRAKSTMEVSAATNKSGVMKGLSARNRDTSFSATAEKNLPEPGTATVKVKH